MRAKSGAGASVSSGANFQARVGAYLIVNALCKNKDIILGDVPLKQVSFETVEAVDDINVISSDGVNTYIQAKATISYSINEKGELHDVIKQFVIQNINPKDRLVLVTTNRASNKVVYDLRAALEAFRTSPPKEFFRDQPKALTEIVDQITSIICTTLQIGTTAESKDTAYVILRRMWVVALDVESTDPLEHAIILFLASKGCIAAEVVWGKIISDCVNYSKVRKTISIKDINESYNKYLSFAEESKAELVHSFLSIEMRGNGFKAGRDVFLCNLPNDDDSLPEGLAVMETYRFDSTCNERIKFSNSSVKFKSGMELPVTLRASTYSGLTRLMEGRPEISEAKKIVFFPIISENDHDYDSDACAKIHSQRLEKAWKENNAPLNCVICGKSVSAGKIQIVELEPIDAPVVGACHMHCLTPNCRVIGQMQNEFFSIYHELVNFDIGKWYEEINGGQRAFHGADFIGGMSNVIIVWSGQMAKGPSGNYVVEVLLAGGGSEIITNRSKVQRFSYDEARSFSQSLNESFEENRSAGDPLCYTDQSKGYGLKSQLLSIFKSKEKITPVEEARPISYNVRLAARYSHPGHWYAPLCYLQDLDTGEVFCVDGTVFLISDPLRIKIYLENWEDIGLVAENYEVPIIATDQKFDEFMRWCVENDKSVIVNPLFNSTSGDLISGYQVQPMEEVIDRHR